MALFTTNTVKTPAKLAEDALATFDKALVQMDDAQAAIEAQKEEHRKTIAQAEAQLADAQGHQDRIARVKGKLQDLLA